MVLKDIVDNATQETTFLIRVNCRVSVHTQDFTRKPSTQAFTRRPFTHSPSPGSHHDGKSIIRYVAFMPMTQAKASQECEFDPIHLGGVSWINFPSFPFYSDKNTC